MAQLEALFNNAREMPKTVKSINVVIDFIGQASEDRTHLLRVLTGSRTGLERRTLVEGLRFYLHVKDVPNAITLVELIIDVS